MFAFVHLFKKEDICTKVDIAEDVWEIKTKKIYVKGYTKICENVFILTITERHVSKILKEKLL